MKKLKKSDMMIALAASVGAGAATFYTMSKSEQPLNTAVESVTPLLNSMTNGGSSGSGGMNNQFNSNSNSNTTNSSSQNKSHSGGSNTNQQSETQTMGPFGMS